MYNDNELYHYGIKGMKWGVRKKRKLSKDEKREYKTATKLNKQMRKVSIEEAAIVKSANRILRRHDKKINKNNTKINKLESKSPNNKTKINKYKYANSELMRGKKQVTKIKKEALLRNKLAMKVMKNTADHIVDKYGKEKISKYKTKTINGEKFYKRNSAELATVAFSASLGYVEMTGVGSKKYVDSEGKKHKTYYRKQNRIFALGGF